MKKKLAALVTTALLGAGLSIAAPSAASASSCGSGNLIILANDGSHGFGCGTWTGNLWGTTYITSGGHNYGAVELNHNGSYYNISIHDFNTDYSNQIKGRGQDDTVQVWIGY